jgi:phage gpG-like protein
MIKVRLEERGSMRPFKKGWWNPTKQEWAPILLEENKPFWPSQISPEGRPWESLKPETKDSDNRILHETGRMFLSASVRAWGNKFIVDTTPYGVVHQLGNKKTPARPWMGVPDAALDKLPSIAWKHILK